MDLYITNNNCKHIKKVFPVDGISDHLTVISEIDISKHKLPKTTTSFRKISKIDLDAFRSDILKSNLIQKPETDLSALCNQHDAVLLSILDQHAPIHTKSTSSKPPTPWMTPAILDSRNLRKRLEGTWRKTRSKLDRGRYNSQLHLCNRLMAKAKATHFSEIISENADNPRRLWNSINTALHRIPPPALPEFNSVKLLCEHFSTFFVSKIETIRSNFPNNIVNIPSVKSPKIKLKMNVFELATEEEVKKLITNSASKSCDLDPIPTSLLKICLDILIKPITDIVNLSIETNTFPQKFREAHVKPLLKKSSLPKNDLKNYRPVSNLNFISKILEKVVASRLQSHINKNDLANPLQSAYRKFHSTESALLKVQNDIALSMDKGEVTALTLLDLSAAFDTIDHTTLTKRLSNWYGITGPALDWFSSYLKDRCQNVKNRDILSDPVTLTYGVPQGSVLGPLLFTLYTTPLSSVISSYGLKHHLYADDTQIYVSLSTENAELELEKLQNCIADVFAWMTDSKLKLNPGKTEFILIGSKLQRKKFNSIFPISILDQETKPSESARNLGVLFDSDLSYRRHVSQTCRSCFYHIRDLRRIRRSLPLNLAKQIAIALVSSKLDYCNSLLYNIPEKDIAKLQRVQNCLARVVTKAPRFSRSVPLLKSLHWLPIKFRIHFKICTLTFRALTDNQPAYLSDLLIPYTNLKQLRSSHSNKLFVPRVKTKTGSRAFSVAGPTLWNALPITIKNAETLLSFRRLLKTHFFGQAFPS